MSQRHLPRCVVQWLDAVRPTPGEGGWLDRAASAVRKAQQQTGFDCGVACLLYAEKSAQGHFPEDINAYTSQGDITAFRGLLQDLFERVRAQRQAQAGVAQV